MPLETYVQKFTNLKFEPAGLTDDPDIRMAQSIMDYIFRRLALDYLSFDERAELGIYTATERARQVETGSYLPVEEEELSEAESLKNDAGRRGDTDRRASDEPVVGAKPAPATARTTSELFEAITGTSVDAPLCLTCGTKMRPERQLLRLRGLRQHQRLQLRSHRHRLLPSAPLRNGADGRSRC